MTDELKPCAECGHSYKQHTNGPSTHTYCRHCPCNEYRPTPPADADRDQRIKEREALINETYINCGARSP